MTSQTFNSKNSSLAMVALMGTPDQLREKLASRSTLQPISTSNQPLDYLESYIKDVLEYDRLFGVDFMKPENPFKMDHYHPEDTTEEWMLDMEPEYQDFIYQEDSKQATSSSEGTDSENEDDFITI